MVSSRLSTSSRSVPNNSQPIMKFIIATVLVAIAIVSAEPPRFRAGQAFARQTAPADAAPAAPSDSGPYAPSGWKPAGQQFSLPARQQQLPQYPPQVQYGPPPQEYGPPATTEEATTESTTTEASAGEDVTTETERPARLLSDKLRQREAVPVQAGPQIFFILPQQASTAAAQPLQAAQPQQVAAGNLLYTLQPEQNGGAALVAVPAGIQQGSYAGYPAAGSFLRTAKLQAVPFQAAANQYYPEYSYVQFV